MNLRTAVVALSLDGLRRKIEALLLPAEVEFVLHLDGRAERERHRRRAQAHHAARTKPDAIPPEAESLRFRPKQSH